MAITHFESRSLTAIFEGDEHPNRSMIAQRMRMFDEALWTHAALVASSAQLLADHLWLPASECALLIDAAWVHDLGKLTISRSILDKPGPLDSLEWTEIRAHPARAADFLTFETTMLDIAPLVRHHHERFDGTGYPDRLAGTAIPFGARIIAVVDAFHAMTSERSYQPSMSCDAAVHELQLCAGSQFDPIITGACIEIVDDLWKVSAT